MIHIKNAKYIYGFRDGIFHYGKKINGVQEIELTPGDLVRITGFLPEIFLEDSDLENLSLEDFKQRNTVGFLMDETCYTPANMVSWGLSGEITKIRIRHDRVYVYLKDTIQEITGE